MSKNICWKIAPVNGYDMAGLESWLAKMAALGWRYDFAAGPLVRFTRTEPRTIQIHLEPIQRQTAEADPEVNELFAAAGWEFWNVLRRCLYVYASPDPEARAHTDPDILDGVLRRFFRQKLLAGLGLAILNFFLYSVFISRVHLNMLRWFWAEVLGNDPVIPALLSIAGLLLLDLSYLLGLFHLWNHRRALREGRRTRTSRSGILQAIGTLLLIPVILEFTFFYFFGMGFSPYDLEGSGFVTLEEIEGKGFRPTEDIMYNMDYISHGDTPLTAENWYWQQYASFPHSENFISLNSVPHLEIYITRYLLPQVARRRVVEWSFFHGYEDDTYETLEPACGLDEILLSQGENYKGEHGAYLILRKGGLVLRADYVGAKDITEFLPRFAEMMNAL